MVEQLTEEQIAEFKGECMSFWFSFCVCSLCSQRRFHSLTRMVMDPSQQRSWAR
jgi:hypothetical protein